MLNDLTELDNMNKLANLTELDDQIAFADLAGLIESEDLI